MSASRYPRLSDEAMRRLLALPTGRRRIVVDTDAHNEIDDQFALAWAFLSQDVLEIEGIYAAPYSFRHHQAPLLAAYDDLRRGAAAVAGDENITYAGSYRGWAERLARLGIDPRDVPFVGPDEGMRLSFDEIGRVLEHLDVAGDGLAHLGSPGYLPSLSEPFESAAAHHLVERALADDGRPLYVVALGAVTNIASAILLEPRIIERIVVVWTSAFPTFAPFSNEPSLNLVQDPIASRLLFDCGVPHVYLPGFYVGAQLTLSLPDMTEWVQGRGGIGDYLYHLYTHNPIHYQRGIADHFGRAWVIWDLINIAWLLNPDWVPSRLVRTPLLDDALYWRPADGRHLMREAHGVNRDAIFADFFRKLEQAPGA